MIKKEILKRENKTCACCGKEIKVIIYTDKSYCGGHYFGKIPICSKKEQEKSQKAGTHKSKMGGHILNVCNYNPKPYKNLEYWECPKCYRGK